VGVTGSAKGARVGAAGFPLRVCSSPGCRIAQLFRPKALRVGGGTLGCCRHCGARLLTRQRSRVQRASARTQPCAARGLRTWPRGQVPRNLGSSQVPLEKRGPNSRPVGKGGGHSPVKMRPAVLPGCDRAAHPWCGFPGFRAPSMEMMLRNIRAQDCDASHHSANTCGQEREFSRRGRDQRALGSRVQWTKPPFCGGASIGAWLGD